ncbi:uncharacterized protein SPPG_08119 [Spizellomyces punctatus DAOM BR117]|uniref:PB1 domain-containing protein n=1 Tax=Spizellomyces punctatus (strain DAOM BR117) TaxID=645134 RepID=A0A0L0H6J2_SPIPD|nr:uncharacterized protein SPPG_08119 [Spizellomyces punctatus DAOM BR117]KNC96531.1 hypothetical protein SPPG_08119 [Spizellomyces punctatus DAOM BR117]|eukprot:XP_016604571.1 hypothetical protein SPPG_08119 [Spizellomyces punctatus DAOM BR117]
MIGDPQYAWPLPLPVHHNRLMQVEAATSVDEVAVKVTLNDIHRRFTLAEANHTELLKTVRSLFGLAKSESLHLWWVDEDGDNCCLDHEAELIEAVRWARNNCNGLLKVRGRFGSDSGPHASFNRSVKPAFNDYYDTSSSSGTDEYENDCGSAMYESESEYDSVNAYPYVRAEHLDDVYNDASSDTETEEPSTPIGAVAYYTPIASLPGVLLRELEDREMEEGLLGRPDFTIATSIFADDALSWHQTSSTQYEPADTKQMGTQIAPKMSEQCIQTDLISFTQTARPSVTTQSVQTVIITKTACTSTPAPTFTASSTQCDAAETTTTIVQRSPTTSASSTQTTPETNESSTRPAPKSTSTSTQSSSTETTDSYTQYDSTSVDVRSGPDGDESSQQKRFKAVGFSHAVSIPIVEEHEEGEVEDETERPGSPYPHEESDEEGDALLNDERDGEPEAEEEEESERVKVNNAIDALQSPGDFVLV